MIFLTLLFVFSSQAFAIFGSDVSKAKEFMKAGMYPQAVSLLEKVINEKPTNAEAHFQLGICYIYQKSINQADERFSSAVKLNAQYGYKIAKTFKQGADDSASKGNIGNAGMLFSKAIQYDPKYKKEGYNFYKRLGDYLSSNDAKVDCYTKASEFATNEVQRKKLGLNIVKIAALNWPSEKSDQYQKIAARLIGQEQVNEFFPGYQDVVIFETPKPLTFSDAYEKEHGQISAIDFSLYPIQAGDLVVIIAKTVKMDKFTGDEIGICRGKNATPQWDETTNGYYSKTSERSISTGTFEVSLGGRKDVEVTVRVTRKVLQKPNHVLISKLLQ